MLPRKKKIKEKTEIEQLQKIVFENNYCSAFAIIPTI